MPGPRAKARTPGDGWWRRSWQRQGARSLAARGRLPRPRRSSRRPAVRAGAGSRRDSSSSPARDVADPRYTGFLDRLLADGDPVAPGACGRAVHARRRPRSRCCIPRRAGRDGARTSTRTRWCCWSSTATSRRSSPATPAFPPKRPCAARLRRVDLLKVGHHGSRGSTGDDWLDALAPDGGGDLGGPERLRPSRAGHARAAARPRGGGAPDRPRGHGHGGDRRPAHDGAARREGPTSYDVR